MGRALTAPTGADLCVVGNVLIDVILKGVPDLPVWGHEVLAASRSEDVGGQGANVARAAVRMGLSTAIVSVVADDLAGGRILQTLAQDSIDVAGLDTVPGDTALALAAVRPDGERAFLTHLGCSESLTAQRLAAHQTTVRDARALAFVGTSNLPGLDGGSVAAVMREAEERGALTVFDPGWSPTADDLKEVLAVTGLFLPNRDEAEAITGKSEIAAILKVLSERCPGTVIVTCGAEGSATLDGDTVVIVDALPVTVDSAVGAGDVFTAGAISGMLQAGDAVAAMVRGTAATSRYISRRSERYAAIKTWRDVVPQIAVRRS